MEVLMMLPFEVTGRVLHEAERVDLWKTRNVSAFLMMLVKTVQHSPDRKDGDKGPYRQNGLRGPHGNMRHDAENGPWGSGQGGYAFYGQGHANFMAVPWMPAYQQACGSFSQEFQAGFEQGAYMASQQQAQQFPSSPAQAPVAPGSPQMVVVFPHLLQRHLHALEDGHTGKSFPASIHTHCSLSHCQNNMQFFPGMCKASKVI